MEELEETGVGDDNHFGAVNLQEVYMASWSMFGDMRKVYGYDDPQKLYPDVLNKILL